MLQDIENLKKDKHLDDLKVIIQKHFRYKAKLSFKDSSKRELHFVLYQAFEVVFSLDERYNSFGAGIIIGTNCIVSHEILGKKISLNSDLKSVTESLRIIDDYCRLRLPDKFLVEYDNQMKENYYDFF